MTLREITIDKGVIYVSNDYQSHSEQALPISKERKSKPKRRKQKASNTKLSPKNKKFFKNKTGERFRLLK